MMNLKKEIEKMGGKSRGDKTEGKRKELQVVMSEKIKRNPCIEYFFPNTLNTLRSVNTYV